jgi:hypothetical protein
MEQAAVATINVDASQGETTAHTTSLADAQVTSFARHCRRLRFNSSLSMQVALARLATAQRHFDSLLTSIGVGGGTAQCRSICNSDSSCSCAFDRSLRAN